jgi:hypothetical protein
MMIVVNRLNTSRSGAVAVDLGTRRDLRLYDSISYMSDLPEQFPLVPGGAIYTSPPNDYHSPGTDRVVFTGSGTYCA